jgi:tartronate-semialdehyde synthase
MKVADAIVQILVKEGISDAFGIPGAGINPVYEFLKDAPISHYCMRHEEACGHAAEGYFKARHRIALAIVTSGPGATNLTTSLYSAMADSVPFLALTGQANSWQLGQEPFQCADIARICEPVAKKTWCVTEAGRIPEILNEAFFLMREGRPGPVLIDLPLDIQKAEIDFDINGYTPRAVTPPAPRDEDVSKAISMITDAEAPVIVLGGGVVLSEAEEDVIRLAEQINAPIITTYMAKGAVPLSHPLNAGHAGIQVGQPAGNKVFLDSDLVLGIGCRFTDRHTGDLSVYRGNRKFIHVDIDEKQFGKVFPPDLSIRSDAGLAAKALLEAAKSADARARDRGEAPADLVKKLRRKTDFTRLPMPPHRVFHEINAAFDEDTVFTTGCGITQIWSGQLQDVGRTRHYIPSGGAGTLGFEIPAAFGAKVACPEKTVCAVLGDFGFTFMGEEIAVASALDHPIIVVIVNNACLGLIRQNQKGAYGYEYEVRMEYNQDTAVIDYVKVAEGFGCLAERVFTPEDLAAALARAKNTGKPYVIDAVCDRDQLCDMGAGLDSVKSFAPEE